MNKAAYDKQKIRAYLLGSLAEEDAEQFDELSFTDDDFAAQLSAAEKDLVDAAVRGELAGAEAESFKDYYRASPLRREKVEFASAFQTFAEKEIAGTETAQTVVENASKRGLAGIFGDWNIFGNLRSAFQFGLAAAALLFMILGGWLWTENRRLSDQASETERKRDEIRQREQELQNQLQTGQTQRSAAEEELAGLREERRRLEEELLREKSRKEQIIAAQKKPAQQAPPQLNSPKPPPVQPRVSIAAIILAPSLRDSSQIPNLSIPPKTDLVAARLELEADEFAAYRVALVDQSNRTLWQSGRIRTQRSGNGKVLSVRFPAKILKAGIYSLVVSGAAAGGAAEEISSYPLRIVLN